MYTGPSSDQFPLGEFAMFEDSYLDSFMEGYIGNWSGDEDRYYAEQENNYADDNWWADRAEDDADEPEDGPDYDEYPGLDDQHDY